MAGSLLLCGLVCCMDTSLTPHRALAEALDTAPRQASKVPCHKYLGLSPRCVLWAHGWGAPNCQEVHVPQALPSDHRWQKGLKELSSPSLRWGNTKVGSWSPLRYPQCTSCGFLTFSLTPSQPPIWCSPWLLLSWAISHIPSRTAMSITRFLSHNQIPLVCLWGEFHVHKHQQQKSNRTLLWLSNPNCTHLQLSPAQHLWEVAWPNMRWPWEGFYGKFSVLCNPSLTVSIHIWVTDVLPRETDSSWTWWHIPAI